MERSGVGHPSRVMEPRLEDELLAIVRERRGLEHRLLLLAPRHTLNSNTMRVELEARIAECDKRLAAFRHRVGPDADVDPSGD